MLTWVLLYAVTTAVVNIDAIIPPRPAITYIKADKKKVKR